MRQAPDQLQQMGHHKSNKWLIAYRTTDLFILTYWSLKFKELKQLQVIGCGASMEAVDRTKEGDHEGSGERHRQMLNWLSISMVL